MTIFDRLSERVGDFLEEVMLPEEIHALHQRAHRAIKRGDYEDALMSLGEAEHRRPNTERTRRLRALCHFYLENIDRAVELFEEALELREEASSHFYLGLCFEKLGRINDAHAHFQRALDIDDDPPFGYDLYFGLGRTYLGLDRPDKATRELRRALRIWPDQTEAAVTLADALRRRERFDEAAEVIRAAVGDHPDRQTLLTLGRIESATGHHAEAARAFEAILQDTPDDHDALLGAARANLELNRPAPANQFLIRALADTDEDADIFALIGETNERIKNHKKARQSYEAALSREPDLLDARIGAARTAFICGDVEAAAEHFETLLHASASVHHAEALLGLGRCRLAMGDPAGARHLLDEADQLHRHRPPALLHALGTVALQSDDPAEALVAFRRALHAEPDESLRDTLNHDIAKALDALRPHWHCPDHFDSTADLVTALSELRDQIRAEPHLESFLPQVYELLSALDSPLSVAILGEFNAGKSTLINAIIGEEVVPMGILPTTAHPCIMDYGPRKGARIVYVDGRLRDADFATARRLMKDEAQDIARLHYTYPHPELRSINYWDTPGFNALDERHELLAKKALEEAEAILWLIDANQALKQTEFARLRAIPDSSMRVILLVNKIDRFGDEDQRQDDVKEIVDYLEEHAGDHVLDVLAISTLEALKARTGDAETTGDFETLLELLDEQFVQRSWRIKISEVSRALAALLDDIEALRTDKIELFHRLITQVRQLSDDVEASAADPQARASEYALLLADRFEFVTHGIEREVDDALRRRGRILRRLVLEPDDRTFIMELFAERLDQVIERYRRQVLREVSDVEQALAERLSPLFGCLSVTDARPLRRRLEGFFDETRALKTVLDERVFGHWRARTDARLNAGGDTTLDAIIELGEDADRGDRQQLLATLIPRIGDEFSDALADWYREFFLAAGRFCDRLQRDLTTLELEVRHRLDFSNSEVAES